MGCGQSKSKPKLPQVVIIGGGYAGTYLACLLQNEASCEATLVDPKDAMIHRVGVVRSLVEPEFLKALFIPLEKCVTNFVRGTAVSIRKEKNTVVLKTGKKISYNYLVIATGTSSPFPYSFVQQNPEISSEDATKKFRELNEAIKKSHRVACVGGGITGVELAGEIKTDYPDKQVIIFHSTSSLVSKRLMDENQKLLKERLYFKDVDLVLDERVTNLDSLILNEHAENQRVKTESGKELEVDLVIPCTGRKIISDLYRTALGESLTESGAVKVNGHLLVENCNNIFAIGDVTNVDEEKNLFSAKAQAKVAYENIKALMSGEELSVYQPADHMMIVTIGRYDGVGQQDGKLLDEDQCRELKGEDFYSRRTWTDLGLEAPRIS